jgi:hypothetical protein
VAVAASALRPRAARADDVPSPSAPAVPGA